MHTRAPSHCILGRVALTKKKVDGESSEPLKPAPSAGTSAAIPGIPPLRGKSLPANAM